MKIRIFVLAILAGVVLSSPLRASHYMGGELGWECLSNGNYRFVIKLYRECAGILYPDTVLINSNSPSGVIKMVLLPDSLGGRIDISPLCNPDTGLPHINCTIPGTITPNTGSMEMWTYTSDHYYPSGVLISGVPPPSGWYFAYQNCCRNPSSNILNASSQEWFLRVWMFPYNGQNTYPCYDNSAEFTEPPEPLLCTGFPASIYDEAKDPDQDSLVFSFAQPMAGYLMPITNYAPGYSYSSPFPGVMHNPLNVPASIDPVTGLITFTSHTQGAFLYIKKAASYRNGIKVSEVCREFQVAMINCLGNEPPHISFDNSAVPVSQYYHDMTLIVGDTAEFIISYLDTIPYLLPNNQPQTILMKAYGSQFGSGFTSYTGGCDAPPCAVLNPPPPQQSMITGATTFIWPTALTHLTTPSGTILSQKMFPFHLNLRDDFCPVPAIRDVTIRITLVHPVVSPSWKCIAVNGNGFVDMEWNPPADPYNVFAGYRIDHFNGIAGQYIPIDTIYNIQTTTYQHQPSGGQDFLYRISTLFLAGSDTLSTDPSYIQASFSGFLMDKTQICTDDTLTLIFTGHASPGMAFAWNSGGGLVVSGTGTGPIKMIFPNPGNYSVSLYLDDGYCSTGVTQQILAVFPDPIAHITGPSAVCPGQPVSYQASGGIGYHWSTGHQGPSVTISPVVPGNISVTVTDTNGCHGSFTRSIDIIHPYQDEEICMVTINMANNKPMVVWEKTHGQHTDHYNVYRQHPGTGITELAGTVNFNAAGEFTDVNADPAFTSWKYTITSVDSCNDESSISGYHQAIRLVAVNSGQDVHLSWYPYSGFTFDKYYIFKQHNSSGFAMIDSVSKFTIFYADTAAPASGLKEYAVGVKKDGVCSPATGIFHEMSVSNMAVPVNPGVEENAGGGHIMLFPNPANRFVTIKSEYPHMDAVQFVLYDLQGRTLLVKHLNDIHRGCSVPLDGLYPGMYLFRLIQGNSILKTGRMILIH